MDAIDELLEAFRSESANGSRNRRVFLLGALSAVTAVVAHRATLGDVDTTAWQGEKSPDWAGGSAVLVFLAPVVVYLGVRTRESILRYALSALLVPVVVLSIGLFYADNRRWQLDAREVFARYTTRLPSGRLHGVYVPYQTGSYVAVCAAEGPQDSDHAPNDRQFCIDVAGDDRQTVVGGYHYNADDGAEYGFVSHDFYDCFGETVRC